MPCLNVDCIDFTPMSTWIKSQQKEDLKSCNQIDLANTYMYQNLSHKNLKVTILVTVNVQPR
ncbi:hypothetical protein ABIB62_000745 [Mucilaginibacter sp. UYP25]